ncbi:hypothetical protein PCASD_04919 [Puccinia coronata f. sp. avenae]|uniref:Uncharacterized protein n=1 Tax=Puccinia coronata f. sp. avenae TaxID=200324 RepID=A0A2N5VD13_9BASI|nr:hypothetical protein PCASD_04919 [Puccinia coronata f. sp. avenae]
MASGTRFRVPPLGGGYLETGAGLHHGQKQEATSDNRIPNFFYLHLHQSNQDSRINPKETKLHSC